MSIVQNRFHYLFVTCCLVFAFATAQCGSTAYAQVTASVYNGPGDFAYNVQSMPDLDQERNGLPNDGDFYCLPTAGLNLFAYAANFGYPDLWPGPGVWQGPQNHDLMTIWIDFMGLAMQTDPDAGTGYADNFNGMSFWATGSSMSLSHQFRSGGYWPNIDSAAFHATNGAIVNIRYGRYLWGFDQTGTPIIHDRQSGHGVTLKQVFANSGLNTGPRLIHYRNPGSDEGDLNSNSDWVSTAANEAINIQVLFDFDDDSTLDPFVVTALKTPPNYGEDDNRYRLIDEVLALYPPGGQSYSGVEVNAIFENGSLGFVQDQNPTHFEPPPGDLVIDVVPHPESHSGLALVGSPNAAKVLYQIPNSGRNVSRLMALPAGTRCLALGFGATVYAATDHELIQLQVFNGSARQIDTISLPNSRGAPQKAGMTYDDRSGQVIVAAGTMLYFVDALNGRIQTQRLRGAIASSNIRSMDAWNGNLIVVNENQVFQARVSNSGGRIAFIKRVSPDSSDPASASVDSSGRLYVSDRVQGLMEYTLDHRGRWQRAETPLYGEFDMRGKQFVAFKSRTNVRPGQFRSEEQFNIPPDELADQGPDVPD